MAKIPLTIITGFLGSGKTTFLSEILKKNQDKKLAIIINEFGEAGLDHTILNQHIYHTQEKTILLQGGCVCCNKREDLVLQLKEILNKPIEHIIIETTGLANPAPILFSILTDAMLQHHFMVNGILTCIDCLNAPLHLQNEEAKMQIAISDKIILTKQDLFKDDLQETLNLIANHNAFADITPKSLVDFREILNSKETKHTIPTLQSSHKSTTHSLSISFKEPLDWSVFSLWLSMLLYNYGEKILRFKGILDTNEGYPIAINSVQHIIHPPLHLKTWERERGSEIVFIFKDLERERILQSFKTFVRLSNQALKIETK